MKPQQYKPILLLREVKSIFTRIKDIVVLFKSGLINEPSCFPELSRKNKFKRTMQLLWYLLRHGEILWQYNLYGLDVKPFSAIKEYIGNKELLWREYKYNVLMASNDYTNIMKDKRLFYLFLRANGFNTPTVFAYTKQGVVCPLGWRLTKENCDETMQLQELLRKKGFYFCKPYNGKCGRGIFNIQIDDVISINGEVVGQDHAIEFLSAAFKDDYIIQEVLRQHPALSVLHDSSVNTLRIITARNKSSLQVEFVTGFIRMGIGGSITDNMAGGGIAAGIDFDTGYIKHYGYLFNGEKSQRIEEHPTLHVPLDSIQIPHLSEAVQTSIRLHERLDDLRLIGWDVAITDDGVSFIEGNDAPDLSQSNHGPMRSIIDQYI